MNNFIKSGKAAVVHKIQKIDPPWGVQIKFYEITIILLQDRKLGYVTTKNANG